MRRLLGWGLTLMLLTGGARPKLPALSWYEPAPPTTMHPLYAASLTDLRAQELVYDRLFVDSPAAGGRTSRVVASHAPTEGGLRVTLHDGIRWHDGERLTAADVCWTVDALRDPRSTSPLAQRFRQLLRSCVVAVDDPLTAEIGLATRPVPDARALLDFPLLPAHLGEGPPGPDHLIATRPIGTGPMAARADGVTWVFTAFTNPHHAPRIRELVLRVPEGDRAAQLDDLEGGVVDGLVDVRPDELPRLRAAKGTVSLHFYPRHEWWGLAVDTTGGLLADARVREALDLAIDREALHARFVGVDPSRREQPSAPISGPFDPASPSLNRGVPVATPDPERAAALLTAAGLVRTEGSWTQDGREVTLHVGVPASLPQSEELAAALAEGWDGFRVEVVPLTPERFRTRALTGQLRDELDLMLVAWAGGSEQLPAVFATRGPQSGAWNVFDHADPALDRLLSEAAAAEDRALVDHEIHALLADTRPYLFLWHVDAWSAWRADLQHVSIAPVRYFTDLDTWALAPP